MTMSPMRVLVKDFLASGFLTSMACFHPRVTVVAVDYYVYLLAGSTNPLTDMYEIVDFANSRQSGEVNEGKLLKIQPSLWFAAFDQGSTTLHSFGLDPESAVKALLTTWAEIVSEDNEIDPQHPRRGWKTRTGS